MRYKELGKTGMKISHLCFGASSLGSVFRSTKEAESIEAVEVAIEGGINFIDVSPYYGHYKAETVLGMALSKREVLPEHQSGALRQGRCKHMGLFCQARHRECAGKHGTIGH